MLWVLYLFLNIRSKLFIFIVIKQQQFSLLLKNDVIKGAVTLDYGKLSINAFVPISGAITDAYSGSDGQNQGYFFLDANHCSAAFYCVCILSNYTFTKAFDTIATLRLHFHSNIILVCAKGLVYN